MSMQIAIKVFYILVYFGGPLCALFLAQRYHVFGIISPVLLCYLIGMSLANAPAVTVDEAIAKIVIDATIPIAIPLLLFSADLRSWIRFSKPTVISFVLACFAAGFSAIVFGQLFADWSPDIWRTAAMMSGGFTGGTPNLLSVGMALEASEETIVLVNAADTVTSGLYLFFLLSLANPILRRFYPSFPFKSNDENTSANNTHSNHSGDFGTQISWRKKLVSMASGVGLSALCVALSIGLSFLFAGGVSVPIVLLIITTAGLGGSMVRNIRDIPGTYDLGNYLILVFCVAIGSLTNLAEMFANGSVLLQFAFILIFSTVGIHYILAKLFKIDVHTLIITSTATILGPPFVIPVAERLQNRQLILSGITTGLAGYAVGNYLALMVAYFIQP